MAEHMQNPSTEGLAAITDFADQAMQEAEMEGIGADEVRDEVGSVFEIILEAIQKRPDGLDR
jgi:hypothetical protein